jgi:hypothetical protein
MEEQRIEEKNDSFVSTIVDIRRNISPRYPPAALLEGRRESIGLPGKGGTNVEEARRKFLLLTQRKICRVIVSGLPGRALPFRERLYTVWTGAEETP